MLLIAAAPLLIGPVCGSPDVRLVEQGVETYNASNPGEAIEAGSLVGVRVPIVNAGNAGAGSVSVLAQLLDASGGLVQQRSLTVPTLSVRDRPVFDFRPFVTDVPGLVDPSGTATFRITVGVGTSDVAVYDHVFGVLPGTPDISALEREAAGFSPFAPYLPTSCPTLWADTAGLTSSLEIWALDPQHPAAISPGEAEPYVRYLADQLLIQTYDPAAPGTRGPCVDPRPHPDTSTGLALQAYMLKVFGSGWSHETQEAIRRAIHLPDWHYLENDNVYNKSIQMPTMRLLFGEAACHAPSWNHSWNQLSLMFQNHLLRGGFEGHDRHYTMYHLGNLGLLSMLDSDVPRRMSRALFDIKALLAAQMYLPGGQIEILNTRAAPFYEPGEDRERAMGPVVEALGVGADLEYAATPSVPHAVTALAPIIALRRPLEPAIRDLFLEKQGGFEAWWLQRTARAESRMPGNKASLGEGGRLAFAWQFSVLPGGQAAIGTSYGSWTSSTGSNEGVALRCPLCEQGFAFTYQWQACHPIDTDDAGDLICSDAFERPTKKSGYDVERMQVHHTRISLIDPRSRFSRWPATSTLWVPRGDERSLAYLPNWDHPAIGGEAIAPTAGGWYVGRLGEVFIAYRPLGDDIQTVSFDQPLLAGGVEVGYATQFELAGRSGGITVVATPDEFAGDSLTDFAIEMDSRFWSFAAAGPNDGPVAEVDYRDADGQLCRMKLEYMGVAGPPGLERRYTDCSVALGSNYQEQPHSVFFSALQGGQLMTSPFVSYDIQTDVLSVKVPSFPEFSYDWQSLRLPPLELPAGCSGRGYLELGEPSLVELATTALVDVPDFDVSVGNAGFGDLKFSVSFQGDDCTAGAEEPNGDWLLATSGSALLSPEATTLATVEGNTAGCDPGQYQGELFFTVVVGDAQDARLPVSLSVSP